MNRISAFLLFLLCTVGAFAQVLEPIDLAKKIYGKEVFPELSKHVTGEYQGVPNGQDIGEDAILKFTLLGQKGNKAVVNMTLSDSIGNGVDTYLFFEKDSIWKMSAFRGLAITGFIEHTIIELENMTSEQIDKMIEEPEDDEYMLFRSREDYNLYLDNLKLIIAKDDDIVEHFNSHEAGFEEMKDIALNELRDKDSTDNSIKLIEEQSQEYRKLLISDVSYGDYLIGEKCLIFSIGGMLDNTVGYLYIENKADLPEMNPSRIIMIREIGNGWYMYKTT